MSRPMVQAGRAWKSCTCAPPERRSIRTMLELELGPLLFAGTTVGYFASQILKPRKLPRHGPLMGSFPVQGASSTVPLRISAGQTAHPLHGRFITKYCLPSASSYPRLDACQRCPPRRCNSVFGGGASNQPGPFYGHHATSTLLRFVCLVY
jgi:hypothetical protein